MGAILRQPAIAKLDTYSANVADGPGKNLPATLHLRSMANVRAMLIFEQGNENMVIPGTGM
eukprot:4121782-Pyramimonas_sp.AAC.1